MLIWALLIGGLATLDPLLIAYALPLIAYLAVGAFARPANADIEAQLRLDHASVSSGEQVEVGGRLISRGAAVEQLQFADQVPPAMPKLDGDAGGMAYLASGTHLDFGYRLQAVRGLHHFQGVVVTATDPFDLFQSEWLVPAERTLLVRPATRIIRRVSVQPLRTGVIAGAYAARSGGPGVEFFGLRRYVPGDPLRWINWKVSARAQRQLYVNLFEQERVIDLGLIVDARIRSNAMVSGGSVYSYSVDAAASLAELFLSQGNRVGLLIYGSHLDWTVPGYGRLQRERIMSALARTSEGESHIFEQIQHLPTRLFRAKTQLILLSPLLTGDLDYLIRLRARRYPLLVISPDRDRVEARRLAETPELELAQRIAHLEQRLITRRLANAGIPRLLWDVDLPFEQLIETRLSRPPAWLHRIGVET